MLNFYIEDTDDLQWAIEFFKQQNFHFSEEYNKLETCLPFGVSLNDDNSLCINQEKGITIKILKENIKNNMKFFLSDAEGKVYGPFKYKETKVNIGDKVKIIYNGFFTSYYNWFKENHIDDIGLVARYAYGNSGNDYINEIGTVVACGVYGYQKDVKIYAIEFQDAEPYKDYNIPGPVFICTRNSFELV